MSTWFVGLIGDDALAAFDCLPFGGSAAVYCETIFEQLATSHVLVVSTPSLPA